MTGFILPTGKTFFAGNVSQKFVPDVFASSIIVRLSSGFNPMSVVSDRVQRYEPSCVY